MKERYQQNMLNNSNLSYFCHKVKTTENNGKTLKIGLRIRRLGVRVSPGSQK
jgi:hypothetical protein